MLSVYIERYTFGSPFFPFLGLHYLYFNSLITCDSISISYSDEPSVLTF